MMAQDEKRVCKSRCATKDVQEFGGSKTCNRCREAKRKCYGKNKNEIIKHEEKRGQRGANYANHPGIR